jgi:hypothetical protein
MDLEHNENGVLTEQELDFIIKKCHEKHLSPEEAYLAATELNTLKVGRILFKAVMKGELDFFVKDGEILYGANRDVKVDDEEDEFPEFID